MSDAVTDAMHTSSALVPWRIIESRAEWLTAVVNVSFELQSGALARLVAARPIAAHDCVPCKPHPEVVAIGQARGVGRAQVVGVAVARGPLVLLQKRLVLLAGADLVDVNGGALVEASDRNEPGRFRVVSFKTLERDDEGTLLISAADDLRSLQLTEPDQWLPALAGGERVRMIGFEGGDVDVRLPDVEPRVMLEGGVSVPLSCDTLELDGSHGLATLTFRGAIRQRGGASRAHTVSLGPRLGAPTFGSPRSWAPARRLAPSPAVDVVDVVDRSGFACWTMRWSPAPGDLRRVLIVKGTFDLGGDGAKLLPAPEQAALEPEQVPSDRLAGARATDFDPVKPLVDVIVHAEAHGGPGKKVVPVRLEVGDVSVELVAMGTRQFQSQGIPGPPADLESIPLTWGHAFGGPDVLENPAGTGAAAGSSPPRIEAPGALMRAFGDRPKPAGVAAIPSTWQLRSRLLGHFDDAWQTDRWPHLPSDFDPAYYQAAAPSLRLATLPSVARVRLTNVRAGGASVAFELPDVRPCAHLFREGSEPLVLTLRLDTLTIDVERGKVFLLWRASYPIAARARPAERIHVARESITQPFSDDAVRAMLAVERDPSWEERVVPVGETQRPRLAEVLERFAVLAKTQAQVRSRLDAAAPEPIDRAALAALIAAGAPMRGRDLTRASLAGADLRNVDLRGAILRGAELTGARLDGANLEGAVLSQAHAADAQFDGANLRRADLARAALTRASFRSARLDYASFARADLGLAVFDGATGGAASFVAARMAKVSADEAQLVKADFTDAMLAGGSFRKADLRGATFQEVDATDVCFDDASLQNARFELARCGKASFERAQATGSTWDGADLTQANLARAELGMAVFGATTLLGASLASARAENARFREADLSGSNLRDAHLKGATFESACLDGASLENANLDEANLTMASMVRTNLERAFLDTTIPRAPR